MRSWFADPTTTTWPLAPLAAAGEDMCNCSAAEFGGEANLVDEVLALGRMNPCDSEKVAASSDVWRRPMCCARILMVEGDVRWQ